jgi:hypothetical protein
MKSPTAEVIIRLLEYVTCKECGVSGDERCLIAGGVSRHCVRVIAYAGMLQLTYTTRRVGKKS